MDAPSAFKALRRLVAEKWQFGNEYRWKAEVEQPVVCLKGRQERLLGLEAFCLSESSHSLTKSVKAIRNAVGKLEWDGLEGFSDCDKELEGTG